MEPKWARTALVGHAAVLVDQIDSIRPASVGLFRAVAEIIHQSGKLDSQLAHAHSGHRLALFNVPGTRKYDLIANVALHLPHVAGMRFEDIHGIELHARTVLVIQLIEGRNLPPKWRSGVAAENEDNRFSRLERGKAYMRSFVQSRKCEVGSHITDPQIAGSSVRPHRLERCYQEDGDRQLR